MERTFKVTFRFRNDLGQWMWDSLSNNGKGFTREDAEDVARQLHERDNVNFTEVSPMPKKYSVSYCTPNTGYGWEVEHDRLDEFEDFINEHRNNYHANVRVWDNTLGKFVFVKYALERKPEVDMLSDPFRDMRTTTRKIKRTI